LLSIARRFSVSNSFKLDQSQPDDAHAGLHVALTCGTAQPRRADWHDDRTWTRGATAARYLDIEKELKMKKIQSRIVCTAGSLMLVFGVAGNTLAQNSHAQHGSAPAAGAQQHAGGGHDMMKTMDEMHQKMSSMPMTGDHDHDFAMMMRSHHQAGVDMARAELEKGKDANLKQMAKKIVSDQTKEIKKLDDWLAKHQASGK